MSYLRVKWIKGYPYLYEQASYRVGKKVKTRHIRYIGRYGYSSGGVGSLGRTGFKYAQPEDLHFLEKEYVDTQISYLKEADNYPYEREILRSYMYFQKYKLNFKMSHRGGRVSLIGYFSHASDILGTTFYSPEMGLTPHSKPFTWMHEMGHSIEFEDKLITEEIEAERTKFVKELQKRYVHAYTLDEKEQFIKDFGKFFDLRDTFEHSTSRPLSEHLLNLIKMIRTNQQLRGDSQTRQIADDVQNQVSEVEFNSLFHSWTRINYLSRPSEVFADAVAGLIMNPKLAYECFGESGKSFLSKVWTKLIPHFEEVYSISLNRPKKTKKLDM